MPNNIVAKHIVNGVEQNVVIGTYSIVKNSTDPNDTQYHIHIEYNDYLSKNKDIKSLGSNDDPGYMNFKGQIKESGNDNHIKIDNGGDFNFPVIDPNKDGQDGKLGPINKYGYRGTDKDGKPSSDITWNLNINYSGIVQAEHNGKISAQAPDSKGVMQDAQFPDSIVIDVFPTGIHFNSVTGYMPVFYYNDKTADYIMNGPLDAIPVKLTENTAVKSATSPDDAKNMILGQTPDTAKPGDYGIYTNNTQGVQTTTFYGQTVTLYPGQQMLLINTGDIGLKEDEVPANTFGVIPATYDADKALDLTTWNTRIAQKLEATQIFDFDKTESATGAANLFGAVGTNYNAGYHFDVDTTADSSFDKVADNKVHNSAMIGYSNEKDQNAGYDVNWKKGDSDIDANVAAGTVLIQKKALDPSTTDDPSTLDGIQFQLTNLTNGDKYSATTGEFTNSSGQIIHGVAHFDNPPNGLPSGQYRIQELSGGKDISDNLYIQNPDGTTYRKATEKDLLFVIDRDHDTSGFAFDLFNPRDSVSVTKKWSDKDNSGATRPADVTVHLIGHYKDGETTKELDTQKLNDGNEWTYIWKNQAPVVAKNTASDGDLISYSVTEDPVTGYTTDIPETQVITPLKDKAGNVISNNYFYTITNSLKQKNISLSVLKDWKDNNDQDGNRPDKITVHLLADGAPAKDSSGNEITYELNAANEWKHTFTNLPQYKEDGTTKINYSFTEDAVTGYTPSFTTSTDGALITITNTPQTVNIIGKKTWMGDNAGAIPDSVKVDLLADGVQVDSKVVTGDKTAKDWSYSFGELPKYKNGKLVVYTVKEEAINGFVAKYSQAPLMVSLAAGATDYTGYKVQFYDNKGAKSGDPVALAKSTDGKTWEAVISDTTVTDYNGYSAKLVDKEGKGTDDLTATLSLDISNTYKMPLPMTGGSGIQKIILIGLSALMISGLYIFWRKRNRKEVA